MVKILKEDLSRGISLLDKAGTCANSHNCFWIKRSALFQYAWSLPRNCRRNECPVIVFRKIFEDESPAFYAEALRCSRFDSIVNTTEAISRRSFRNRQKESVKLATLTSDLHTFGELVILTIYPLYLETKQIPFLWPKEIAELRNKFDDDELRRTIAKMNQTSSDWLSWVDSVKDSLYSYAVYPRAMTYLVYLFFKGLEKSQPPDLKNLPESEKEKFFEEIMRNISRK